jgi:hypothetical protein
MDKNYQDELSVNEILQVLMHPTYQKMCSDLFSIFSISRQPNHDPKSLLAIQAGLAEILLELQEKKREFYSYDQKDGCLAIKRLILIVKQIGDSIAWRSFGFNRTLIQLLSEHSATGYLDDTVHGDFAIADEIIKQSSNIVLINDITNVLRFGDLTIIDSQNFDIVETKHGKASSQNRRSRRQKKNLDQLRQFVNTSSRFREGRQEYIFPFDGSISTYHSILEEGIKCARNEGYCQTIINDCVAIDVIDINNKRGEQFSNKQPFEGYNHLGHLNSVQIFDKPATRIAPFGIFPLKDQDCFDLITGSIVFRTTINFDCLQQKYKEAGINLELPNPRPEEMERYIRSNPGERKKLFHLGAFKISEGELQMTKVVDTFGLIFLDLFQEHILIETDHRLINFVKGLKNPINRINRFYLSFQNENQIWK